MNNNPPTRYILIGGEWKNANDKAADWQQLMTGGIGSPAKILVCLFSRDKSRWAEKFERIKGLFQGNLGDGVICELAQPDTFIEQINKADVIYIDEGDNVIAEYALGTYDELQSALTGKTIVGSSAGANVLSYAYYTRSLKMVRDGLGILPIKIIVHYGTQPNMAEPIDWKAISQKVHSYGDTSLPIYLLREREFIVVDENGQIIQDTTA